MAVLELGTMRPSFLVADRLGRVRFADGAIVERGD